MLKEPKSESAFKQPPGLERGSDDRGLGAKKDPSWGKQPEQVMTRDTDSLTTEKYLEGKKDVLYLSEDRNNQNDPYRDTNAWGKHPEMNGKCQKEKENKTTLIEKQTPGGNIQK